jgi:hypothetical protein
MKARFLSFSLSLAAVVAIAGCGGGGGSITDSTDPASVAPADSLFFLEVTRPEGKAAANVDALAKKIAGIDDLGKFIVSELESSALESSGSKLDYSKDVAPWLGKKAAFFPSKYDGDDFSEGGAAVEATDPAEAEEFIQERAEDGKEPASEESFDGVDYWLDPKDGSAIGVIGNFVAYAEDRPTFEAMVDAAKGDSLAEEASYTGAVSSVPDKAVADVWVDIGGIVRSSGGDIDPETRSALTAFGIEPEGATAVASAIPGSDQIEITLSSDLLDEAPEPVDLSFFLSSMPEDSVAAVATPEAGEAFTKAVDRLDREGLPEQGIEPHKLKSVLKEAGVDLDSIGASIGDGAAFLGGGSKASLGGGVVLVTYGDVAAKNTVADVALLLRASGTSGISSVKTGLARGIAVRNSDLGEKPLVIAAVTDHIVVTYGLGSLAKYATGVRTLADNPVFKEAEASLGYIPINGFAEGHAALRLASALVSPGDEDFRKAKRYLTKIDFLALGSESTDDLAKAKLIVGIGK